LWPGLALTDTLRIATFNAEMARKGPGLLLRDIQRGKDAQVTAVIEVITAVAPDVLVLQGVDFDHDLIAAHALRDAIAQHGPTYPHVFAHRPNTGMATGLDMDGDGRTGRARDAQGYGLFAGQGGMVVLSRYPVLADQVQDFSALLWSDLPGALLPTANGAPFPTAEAQAIQRLSSTAHWVVPLVLPDGQSLHLMTFHASPPVFDGPEDRNGRRNHDEARLWTLFLDGQIGVAPDKRFVLLGDANMDIKGSNGRGEAMQTLLNDSRLQDPLRGVKTVDWPTPGPGQLRVDYVLPSADLAVMGAGVFWPDPGDEMAKAARTASRHRLVWVDVDIEAGK